MNSTNASNSTTKMTTVVSPLVAYDFSCSYLGTPRPIQTSELLGGLRPPLWRQTYPNHNSSTTTSTTFHPSLPQEDKENQQAWLSCPRRTIDGMASQTILQSEDGIARLQSHPPTLENVPINSTATSSSTLAVEVWFTPLLDTVARNYEWETPPLLPIVSIAEPLENTTSSNSHKWNTRRDPCQGIQLLIGQRGEFLEVVYRDHYEYLPDSFFDFDDDDDFLDGESPTITAPQYACRVLRLTQWNLRDELGGRGSAAVEGLLQLVVAWKASGSVLQLFGNGKIVVDIDLLPGHSTTTTEELHANMDFLRHWDSSFRLQVFSDAPRWFERSSATPAPTETSTNSTTFNHTRHYEEGLFPGAIHKIALYKQDFGNDIVASLYQAGIQTRDNPFRTFFEDSSHPFEPLGLEAVPMSLAHEPHDIPLVDSMRGVPVQQGSSARISVGAVESSNTTTALWDVLVELVELPKYGKLFYPNNTTHDPWEAEDSIAAEVGDRLLLPEGLLRTSLWYQHLQEDYFSLPKRSYDGSILPTATLPGESFSYRLIATKKQNETLHRRNSDHFVESTSMELLGRSEAVQQELTILHKNHAPVLVGLPPEVWQPEWQPTGLASRPWATLGTDVVLQDEKDYDMDRVRLDLWANHGTLTIDLDPVELQTIANVTSCANPKPNGQDWICDGTHDWNMTVLATPTSVSRILSNLLYEALEWNASDAIAVHIYDGSGGLCPGQHAAYDTDEECFSIRASVDVPPLVRPHGGPETGNLWKDHRGWWIGLMVVLAILFMCCCCAIACWRRWIRIRQLNKIAVSDVQQEDPKSSVVLASPHQDDFSVPSSLQITAKDQRRAAPCKNVDHSKDESAV